MPDTTLEEAKRCPKCKEPGEFYKDLMGQRRGSKVKVFLCKNDRCSASGETWIVQVNADGTIPNRQKGPKEFPNSQRMVDMGKSYVDYLKSEVNEGEVKGMF